MLVHNFQFRGVRRAGEWCHIAQLEGLAELCGISKWITIVLFLQVCVMSRAQLVLQESTELVVSQGPQGLLDPLVRLEQGQRELLQLSHNPLGSEVKRGMGIQDPQVLDKPGFKDGMAHQVLAEQPEQRRPSQAQQGWQDRLDRLVTQPARQDP